jgi:hypothetical protein
MREFAGATGANGVGEPIQEDQGGTRGDPVVPDPCHEVPVHIGLSMVCAQTSFNGAVP